MNVRFRFSLGMLLIAMAWSAVVVWPNTRLNELPIGTTTEQMKLRLTELGWPWKYSMLVADSNGVTYRSLIAADYWTMAADAAFGILLVVMLTWATSLLLRRVTARLRRGRLPPQSTN